MLDLAFPTDRYSLRSTIVMTPDGQHDVCYRHYENIPYVGAPVDLEYQSMCVSVPEAVDGRPVDCADAPILLSIGVGGYFQCRSGWIFEDPREHHHGDPNARRHFSGAHELALCAGIVVVAPGCRGRGNQRADGTYYGKGIAGIADLKAAVRYIRHNRGVFPGDSEKIISRGSSAGGGLSALLGSTGNNPAYAAELTRLGACDERDDVFASACFCPVTDLEHADMGYEWLFGSRYYCKWIEGFVDPVISAEMAAPYPDYLASLRLVGHGGFGRITAENAGEYLRKEYLLDSARRYLFEELDENERAVYLRENPWLHVTGGMVDFTWEDYLTHVGRLKPMPAYDAWDLGGECSLFGTEAENARHFTEYAQRRCVGEPMPEDLKLQIAAMNPMPALYREDQPVCDHWWIRLGSSDNGISFLVSCNLATRLENMEKDVDYRFYWDAGHVSDLDPDAFIRWVCRITGWEPMAR